MSEIHKYIGYAIVGGFGARIMGKTDAGKVFWGLVAVMQVVAAVQALIGVVLFLTGGRVPNVLHYAYGFFPLLAFIGAHAYARNMTVTERPYRYLPFALVGFVSMGLTLRALMTGLGIG